MRYVLSGIAGVIVSFSLFLAMTYMIKVEGVEVTPPAPEKKLVFVEPEESRPDKSIIQPPPKPILRENLEPVERILDFEYTVVEENLDISDIPDGTLVGEGLPIDSLPPLTLHPESRFPPRYPLALQSRGIEGYVLIENTVDTNGRVVHVEIIESSHSGFERAVRNSAVRWTYPKSDKLKRTHQEKVAFVLED